MTDFDPDAAVEHVASCADCDPGDGVWCPVGESLTSMLDAADLADIEAFHRRDGGGLSDADRVDQLRLRDDDGTPTADDLEALL